MLKVLALTLTAAASAAYAQPASKPHQWMFTGVDDMKFNHYVDLGSALRHGDIVMMWSMQDVPPQFVMPGLSYAYSAAYDCRLGYDKPYYWATYSGHMATGRVLESSGEEDWKPISGGEWSDRDLACRFGKDG